MEADILETEKPKIVKKNVKDVTEKPVYALKKIFHIFLISIFSLFIICGGLIIFHNQYFVPFYVNGQSMYPTLNEHAIDANGVELGKDRGDTENVEGHRVEYGIMDTHESAINSISRFNIVVTHYPTATTTFFIKRVIALPGETFYVEPDGDLFIKINDTFTYFDQPIGASYIASTGEIGQRTLSENEYFVMGDNRGHSSDSRTVGPIAKSFIVGKVVAIEGDCTISGDSCKDITYKWPRWY